ncbi:MAG: divergent polysaccharide deacetylase family protein [Bacillota bacterium]
MEQRKRNPLWLFTTLLFVSCIIPALILNDRVSRSLAVEAEINEAVDAIPEAWSPRPADGVLCEAKTQPKTGRLAPGDLVLIMDDVGYGSSALEVLADSGMKLNFAVLPKSPRAIPEAEFVYNRGHEVLLHIPMEPIVPGEDPVKAGAVMTYLTDEEIRDIVTEHIEMIPFALGANNHMGSQATRNKRVMRAVLSVLGEHGMYFIDSMTTHDSVSGSVASELGVKFAQNKVFIDNRKDLQYIKGQILYAARMSLRFPGYIAIGHVHPVTAEALIQTKDELDAMGVRLLYLTELFELMRSE